MGVVFYSTYNMRIFITLASLLALTECRRHLCDDGTRPVCPDGTRAVYNRPTGKNSKKSKYFPPPVCSGKGPAICLDGSTPKVRLNTCLDEKKKCPKGKGQGPHDKPYDYCADGSQCKCPGVGNSCKFYKRRCANNKKCRKRCKAGRPHCPWFTKNRNPHNGTRIYNTGPNRPGNKEGGHHFGVKYTGNDPKRKEALEGYNYCKALFDVNGCSFLYDDPTDAIKCCFNWRFRNEHCKCDCCYDDPSCIRQGPACNVPDGPPFCLPANITWPPPVCPWRGPQEPSFK